MYLHVYWLSIGKQLKHFNRNSDVSIIDGDLQMFNKTK